MHNSPDSKPNRLINEKSPYLLQHAYNPVDWRPWGGEAFDAAIREDKPIFLSIGYSTCHWCHVMEHESFEDPGVAKLMNDAFICVKVDREERPDIDHYYMTICQMMTGSGGWPLNVILTPEQKVFFAGTYFPKESRFGRMGMVDLAPRISEIWKTKREDILKAADQVFTAVKQMPENSPGMTPGFPTLDQAYQELGQRFDAKYGGFGPAPKFPTPHNLLFLLRYWKRATDPFALEMVEKTLRAMRRGGIYDQFGFGFHRYSTDEVWLVPHFEKMLYDQALIAMAYIETFQVTGDDFYADTAKEIFTYILRDMTSQDGAFYSAEDADSEGHEGKFYVWNMADLVEILGDSEARFMSMIFNFQFGGNFKDEASGTRTGANIPYLSKSLEEYARELGVSIDELKRRIENNREKIFAFRETRIHPHKDDKILTDWNGLMIAALAKGAKAFNNEAYGAAASRAADFILRRMRDENGALLHRFRDGEAALQAHADDYAFLIWGLIDLYEATFDPQRLKQALDLNSTFMDKFWDEKAGGFYFTALKNTEVPIRRKEIYDGATPSGNSVAMLNLLRLGRLTARSELEQKADLLSRAFAGNIEQYPAGYTQMLCALEFALGHSTEAVIVGTRGIQDTEAMIQKAYKAFLPNTVLLFKPSQKNIDDSLYPDFISSHQAVNDKATAYVCLNYNCEMPTNEPDKMLEMLNA